MVTRRTLLFNLSLDKFESSLIQWKSPLIELGISLIPTYFHIADVLAVLQIY